MPKAPSASMSPSASTAAPGTNGRPALRRNQACRQCRKRKLKCDANRPHCGTCVKQWQALISVPAPVGYAHPNEPQCSYDPIEGLSLAPDADPMEKIRALEEQIASLKSKLGDSPNQRDARSLSPTNGPYGDIMLPVVPPEMSASPGAGHAQPIHQHHHQHQRQYNIALPEPTPIKPEPSFMSLLFSGWNTDLPEPARMFYLVETFFRCDPCGSRILHRPSFMASLQLPPKDPKFPHPALLHAICASASRWASHSTNESWTDAEGNRRDTFAEYHASKTRQYIDRTVSTGRDIFPTLQALILLSWYFYTDGRWVEVWIFAGFQTRVAIPLRLNYPGTFTPQSRFSPGAYLAKPKDMKELEERRRTWWMAVMFDRIVSMGGWVHGIDERDIGTEFPLRTDDFYSVQPGEVFTQEQMPSNPQDLSSKDLFTSHPVAYTDSFILFLKAMLIFGRVTDFNVRGNLRSRTPTNGSQDPLQLPGFVELDRLVTTEFFDSLPAVYRTSYGLGTPADGGVLDTDTYMLHVVMHAATITLHTPFISFANPNSVSTGRCIDAAQKILDAYYVLAATPLDVARLHPFVTICWYLAAVVQIHICKFYIEIGNVQHEAMVWENINMLRMAMLKYGERAPIGKRQEKLLSGLMQEIVRMTSQKQPLEVGVAVPLFPFSAATAFARPPASAATDDGSPGHVAPLPVGTDAAGSSNGGFDAGSPLGATGGASPQMGVWSAASASPPMGAWTAGGGNVGLGVGMGRGMYGM